MKTLIALVSIQIIISCHCTNASENSGSLQEVHSKRVLVMNLIGRRFTELWTWLETKGKSQDTFIGRCFGAAKKLQFIMPLIIFKLGVIITTLVFLTIFSLKGLALLIGLVVMNLTGFAAKWASQKHGAGQGVHLHVHQNKHGQYQMHHGSSGPAYESDYYEHAGWSDKNYLLDQHNQRSDDNDDNSLAERLKLLNVYDSYRR